MRTSLAALWQEPWDSNGFRLTVTYAGGVLSESLNGNLIASYSTAAVGPDIFLGMYDINGGSAGVTGLADQNYVLFDNLVVTGSGANQLRPGNFGRGGIILVRRRSRKA